MKIKIIKKSYSEVKEIPQRAHKNPKKSLFVLRYLMKALGKSDLKDTDFSYKFTNIKEFPDEPCLIFMNHSSFIDLEIASNILFPKPFGIVCTSDGFVGKELLMRYLGCIPTQKFVSDTTLISDIKYALNENKTHVLMYPEASYTFDGCATPLPKKMGAVLKLLKTPVLMITTSGAFARDPLYNMLKKRKVKVSAEVKCLFNRERLKELSVDEIDGILADEFSFDAFKWQNENKIKISEPFRADGLERILYKCPKCQCEGEAYGEGITLRCKNCGASFVLDECGVLSSENFALDALSHIPNWYAWERASVKSEIESGTYRLECGCRILVFRDYKAIYDIGHGHLIHGSNGFSLVSDDGELSYTQAPSSSYSLYADYFWYEVGDIICIGNNDFLYYCVPDACDKIPVAKARLAAEEMYKIIRMGSRR